MKNLTKREQEFLLEFLKSNDCGARSSEDLLQDNYSCQCIEDLREIMPYLSTNQIGGFLSSLQEKGILYIEDDRGYDFNVLTQKREKLPNLYWIGDDFLENNSDLSW